MITHLKANELGNPHLKDFSFISNTFISNARLKFAYFQNLSREILRTEL